MKPSAFLLAVAVGFLSLFCTTTNSINPVPQSGVITSQDSIHIASLAAHFTHRPIDSIRISAIGDDDSSGTVYLQKDTIVDFDSILSRLSFYNLQWPSNSIETNDPTAFIVDRWITASRFLDVTRYFTLDIDTCILHMWTRGEPDLDTVRYYFKRMANKDYQIDITRGGTVRPLNSIPICQVNMLGAMTRSGDTLTMEFSANSRYQGTNYLVKCYDGIIHWTGITRWIS